MAFFENLRSPILDHVQLEISLLEISSYFRFCLCFYVDLERKLIAKKMAIQLGAVVLSSSFVVCVADFQIAH